MKKISILAIDDHQFIREMWRLLFLNHATVELIGDSGSFDEGVELIKLKRPDIVLLDINLNSDSGMNAVPLIRKYSPGSRIIAVSMHNEPAYAKKMLNLGAKAYITKNSSHKEVFTAIEMVMKGGVYVCAEIKEIITNQVIHVDHDAPDIRSLSLREIEIIKFIKEGLSSKEIASKLSISSRTVEVHRHNILSKLKMKNATTLIQFINSTDLSFN